MNAYNPIRPGLIGPALVAGLLSIWSNGTLAVNATADLTSNQRFIVQGCGRDTEVENVSLRLRGNRRWTAETSNSGTFRGNYKQNKTGRNFTLTLNGSSRRAFRRELEEWATELCETRATATGIDRIRIKMKVNKKKNKVLGSGTFIRVNARGQTAFGSGRATYRAKLRGSYSVR